MAIVQAWRDQDGTISFRTTAPSISAITPTTDTEVQGIFATYSGLLSSILWGLYQTYRAQGYDVLDAYMATLLDHVQAGEKAPTR